MNLCVNAQNSFWINIPVESDGTANKVIEDIDGDFVLVGSTYYYSKSLVAKISSKGTILWNKNYIKGSSDMFTDIIELGPKNQYLICGISVFYNIEGNGRILNINKDKGNVIFDSVYPALPSGSANCLSFLGQNDTIGTIVTVGAGNPGIQNKFICGYIQYSDVNGNRISYKYLCDSIMGLIPTRIFRNINQTSLFLFPVGFYPDNIVNVIKTDFWGDQLYIKGLSPIIGNYTFKLLDVIQNNENSFFLLTDMDGAFSGDSINGYQILDMDSNLNIRGKKFIYSNKQGENPYFTCMAKTSDGGIIVAGRNRLLKCDNKLNNLWIRYIDTGETSKTIELRCIKQSRDGGYFGCGTIFNNERSYKDILIFKTDSLGSINKFINNKESQSIKYFPNPSNNFLSIEHGDIILSELIFIDLLGKETSFSIDSKNPTIELNTIKDGLYIIIFKDNEHKIIQKGKIVINHFN